MTLFKLIFFVMSVGGWERSVTGLGKYEIFHFYLAACPFVCPLCLCVYMYMCVSICVCMCVCMCICMYVNSFGYIFVRLSANVALLVVRIKWQCERREDIDN